MFHGYDYSKFTGGTDLERAKTISGAVNFIMDREKVDDKDSFVKEALMLHQALSLCSSLVDEESRFEAAFFVEEGYASFDMTMPEYDIDAIQDLWMKNNPDFIGYNCRITAFGLMKDLITVQDTGGRNTEYLFLDEAALDAGELFTAEEREKFETVFSEIKTDASTDTKKQIGVQREYWKKAGVTFDGESKLSLITVYLHSHIDENENSLIAGHAGVLLDTGNEILFFEKISFELPYQLIRFEDRDQLKEYLMRCYDVDTTGECASPFILENDRVL